jgi:hypothetical protein
MHFGRGKGGNQQVVNIKPAHSARKIKGRAPGHVYGCFGGYHLVGCYMAYAAKIKHIVFLMNWAK